MQSFNRLCHYRIPVLETSLRMAVLRPKQIEAHHKWQINVLLLFVQMLHYMLYPSICYSGRYIMFGQCLYRCLTTHEQQSIHCTLNYTYYVVILIVSLTLIITLHQKTQEMQEKFFLVTGSNKTQEMVTYCTTYECWQKPYLKMEAEYFWTDRIWINQTNMLYWPKKQIVIKHSHTHEHILCSLVLSELHLVAENSIRCSYKHKCKISAPESQKTCIISFITSPK